MTIFVSILFIRKDQQLSITWKNNIIIRIIIVVLRTTGRKNLSVRLHG